MRILAVDDDPIILDLLKMKNWLGDDHDLTCCEDAEEALQAIAQAEEPFETFLLDVFMPGKDGITLCTEIRTMADYAAVPIVVMTVNRDIDVMHRALDAGATDFVNKPLDGLELGIRIRNANTLYKSLTSARKAQDRCKSLSAKLTAGYVTPETDTAEVGLLNYLALENRILSGPSGCLALRLSYMRASQTVTAADIPVYADALLSSLSLKNTDIAYVGNDTFVFVTYGRRGANLTDLAPKANEALSNAGITAELTFGAAAESGVWTGRSCIEALRGFITDNTQATAPIVDNRPIEEANAEAIEQTVESIDRAANDDNIPRRANRPSKKPDDALLKLVSATMDAA